MEQIPIEFAIISPAIIALVKAVKTAGVESRYLPLVAIGIGIISGVVVLLTTGSTFIPSIAGGILAGAGAVGFHQTGSQLRDSE